MYGILSNQFYAMDTMLPRDLVQILACPLCKGELIQSSDARFLHCTACDAMYPVVEGIPVFLPLLQPSTTKSEAT